MDELYINFDEYIRQGEPGRREAAYAWSTAIGLQAVDGLKTSEYLQETARRHIEGDITIDEARQLIKTYYENKSVRTADDDEREEADRVSANIVKVLSHPTFAFNANGYISVHRRIFEGVFKHAGQLRKYDITKREWVLRGDTVSYLNWEDLRRAIDYDIKQEKDFDHTNLSPDDFVRHLCQFVSGLWQIHPFREGNTRTTAVFTIQYLRSLGFNVDNDLFAKHSWYFRNALVRANYSNYQKKIFRDTSFLEMFFRNLLFGENNELRNRYMVINPLEDWKVEQDKYRTSTGQVQDKLHTDNVNILSTVKAIGNKQMSVREMMEALALRGRDNFLSQYLSPAIAEGFVTLLYPDKPHHPRQKYLLTVKGTLLLNHSER
ncbi:MAG: Fic family protein [Prevotella sp.]|nr:Fic family protein [Prevotella sp.]